MIQLPPSYDAAYHRRIITDKKHQDVYKRQVQETDLAGHSQSAVAYREILETADRGIGAVLKEMEAEDILVVMADHGNDPNIGHSRHTRECVPLLIYTRGMSCLLYTSYPIKGADLADDRYLCNGWLRFHRNSRPPGSKRSTCRSIWRSGHVSGGIVSGSSCKAV